MLPFIFICLSVISAFAQQDVLQVIRVDEIMPLLSTLINSGTANLGEAATHITEFVPGANLQGAMGTMVRAAEFPFSAGASTGTSFLKGLGIAKHIPVIGALIPSLDAYTTLKASPEIPTLTPLTPPEELARMAADMGIKTSAATNTMAAVASMPAHAVAAGATRVATAFENGSNMVLGTPSQINELLQFQHSLWESYLAGISEADSTVSPQALRDDLRGLAMREPHLTALMNQQDNPVASGALAALGRAFSVLPSRATPAEAAAANAAESLLIDPTSMKIALSNIALNFIQSISGVSRDSATERIASDP